jgi:hypothetical protein
MKRICLGTMITLLYQSRKRSADKIKTVCGGIFAAFGLDIDNYNKELPSHLKSGHDPVPGDLIDAARTLPIEDIDRGFEAYVIPLIHNEKHEAVFRAIKDILRDDTTILDTTVVGKKVGFEKESILKHDSFDESALLANVVTYAITSTDNEKLGANIREIGTGYVDGFIGKGEDIFFISPLVDQDQVSPLKRTLKDPMFDHIFQKATDLTISGMSNPARACVFYIDPNNCKFRFRDLKDFIINNIGSYVFSRAQTKRITDRTKNKAAVGSQAMLKFMQKYGTNAETVLGEILLYIFMEQELDAPKIMSKIELDEYNRGVVSKSDGVHLLSLNRTGQPFHQLVFGASDIVGDLSAAVDRAFDKIINIEANGDDELRMVESTTQWTIYDPDATQYMVELMRPQRGGSYKPDMAFGAFLGYTIQLDTPETDSQKYKTAVKDQLIKDIAAVQPHITDLITRNGLSGYSFYFYVFPFNDAPNEKVSIINELLTGGVV